MLQTKNVYVLYLRKEWSLRSVCLKTSTQRPPSLQVSHAHILRIHVEQWDFSEFTRDCLHLSALSVGGGECLEIQMPNSHSHSLPASPSFLMSPIFTPSSAPLLSSSYSPAPSPTPYTVVEPSNRPNMVRFELICFKTGDVTNWSFWVCNWFCWPVSLVPSPAALP